jgi:hypothetical protein
MNATPRFGVIRPQFNSKKTLDINLIQRRSNMYNTQNNTPKPVESKNTGSSITDYVLYTHVISPSNVSVTEYIKVNNLSIHIQDVTKLHTKPEWLRGVPTLANTYDGIIHTGTRALDIIYNLKPTEPPKIDIPKDAEINNFGRKQLKPSFDNLFTQEVSDIPQKNTNVTTKAIDEMLASRNISKLPIIHEDPDEQKKSQLTSEDG